MIEAASWFIAGYIWLVYKTSAWHIEGFEHVQKLKNNDEPFIVAFWHNRLLLTCYAWPHWHPFHMLISSHKDGQLIARTVNHFGIHVIPGSKTRGGTGALKKMIRLLKQGHTIGITPDGPRGPAFHISEGTLALAKLAKAKIIPLAYAAQNQRKLGTWDQFVFPFPFSKGVFKWGKPLKYDNPNLDTKLKQSLDDLCKDIDPR